MIFALIVAFVLWFLFGNKAMAWAIMVGAIVFALAVFFAPPIKIPNSYSCKDDYTSVPMKICQMEDDK